MEPTQDINKSFTPLPQKDGAPVAPEHKASSKKGLLILMILFLILIVLGAAYFLVIKVQPNLKSTLKLNSPTVIPSPLVVSPTISSTESAELLEAESIDIGSIEADMQDIEKDLAEL